MVPFRTWISPSASVEAGHCFPGDANALVGRLVGDPSLDSALLKSVSYTYVNLHLGLELGSRRVSFYVHGGWSYIDLTLHPGEAHGMTFARAPRAHGFTGSGRIGLIVYLL